MDPKFQSSFIPKGPFASTAPSVPTGQKGSKTTERSLFSFLSLVVFIVSVFLALAVFGYKFYLKYSIGQMSVDLENARATLEPEVIRELTRLDSRLIASQELIARHQILSPLFGFLEDSTPRTVRFSEFSYSVTERGSELSMRGEARGYTALALQAEIFNKSQYFKNSIFSDLRLNDRGDVNFSFSAIVDPSLLSYQREVERVGAPVVVPTESVSTSTATTVSTSSPQATPNQDEE